MVNVARDDIPRAMEWAERMPDCEDAWKRVGDLALMGILAEGREEAEARAVKAWEKLVALRPDDGLLALRVRGRIRG